MTCITVDNPTKLFVTDHFIVTHNTRLISERARHYLADGLLPSQLAVITFTVAAAGEMEERIGHYDGLFIGTIHGLMYRWLCASGKVAEAQSYAESENFDQLFDLVKENPKCIPHLDTIIIDEAQDMDEEMWSLIFEYINPARFFIVGDHRQVIYSGFRNVQPKRLLQIAAMPGVTTYELDENYRNGGNILNFARRIISREGPLYMDSSFIMRQYEGWVEHGDATSAEIKRIMKNVMRDDYINWFILTPTNADVDELLGILKEIGIPCHKLSRAGLTTTQLNEIMKQNKVIVGTIHSSKGLERNNVIVYKPFNQGVNSNRINYVAATRARNRLYWLKTPTKSHVKKNFGSKTSSWE